MTQDQGSRLREIARRAMVQYGMEPEFPPQASAELRQLQPAGADGLRDLRGLPWSSIDNDESRDLDQLEVAVDGATPRVLVAIADVDALVRPASAIDAHARKNTTSVYTPARVFAMLPPELSTDLTSLNQGEDRAAIVVDMTVGGDGTVTQPEIYRAVVRNRAKLTYAAVGDWLEERGPLPDGVARVAGLEGQLRLQDRMADLLRAQRQRNGALDFDRTEVKPVLTDGRVSELRVEQPNRARDLIESFMVAANGVSARFLSSRKLPSIRRVVRSPERWPRIVELARQHGTTLPDAPDALALEAFLKARRAAAPDQFGDLSLSVIKLLGRGEYVAEGPKGQSSGHFALAVSAYTHSTAPNRRYPDLVTERLLKAAIAGTPSPYTLEELSELAAHCTRQEDAANKVERLVRKAAAAIWMSDRIGQTFNAVVTGASPKGTWVRIDSPPVEGKLEQGTEGLDVGDRLEVRLMRTDPERGFIDFVRK